MYVCNEYGRGIKRPALVRYMVMLEGVTRVVCMEGDTLPITRED